MGSVGMSKNRISEVVFILDKLRDLDCYPDALITAPANLRTGTSSNISSHDAMRASNASSIASGQNFKKGHLVELMPILSELILRNEQAIKESLRMIFLEISTALNENLKAVQEALMNAH